LSWFDTLAQVLGAEMLYMGYIYAMYQWKPVATVWVFMVPYLLSTLAMMFGNW
jgi:hypothetical protein